MELQLVLESKGSDIDGAVAGDVSGYSVSLSSDGTIVAIGAYLNDGNSSNSNDNRGHVRIYKYVSNEWKKVGIDISGTSTIISGTSTILGDESGRSVSLSSDGTVVAIGSIAHDINKGHVRIFEIDEIVAREWDSNTPLAELVIDFGDNKKKNLTRYNIWASTSNSNGAPKKWTLEGSNDGTNWTILDERDNETIWPTITGTSADESLHESNAYYIPKGHVRVYNFSSGGWLSLGDDIDNTVYANESYSKSIDISGDGSKLIIGIPTYNNGYGRVESRSFINDGSYNVFIGYEVGYSNTTGLSNVYIGYKPVTQIQLVLIILV